MDKNGPIVLVEDDHYDVDTITAALKDLGMKNEIRLFTNAEDAVEYLLMTLERPFVILSDIRMPKVDGLSFLKTICETPYLKRKSIPFVFFTGVVSADIVEEAYLLSCQGFFKKADTYDGIKSQLSSIFAYWLECLHPNKFG